MHMHAMEGSENSYCCIPTSSSAYCRSPGRDNYGGRGDPGLPPDYRHFGMPPPPMPLMPPPSSRYITCVCSQLDLKKKCTILLKGMFRDMGHAIVGVVFKGELQR